MERLRVSINPLICAGTGYCAEVMPSMFELGADGGPALVLDPQPPPDLLDDLREAETLCPTQAIRVELPEEM